MKRIRNFINEQPGIFTALVAAVGTLAGYFVVPIFTAATADRTLRNTITLQIAMDRTKCSDIEPTLKFLCDTGLLKGDDAPCEVLKKPFSCTP